MVKKRMKVMLLVCGLVPVFLCACGQQKSSREEDIKEQEPFATEDMDVRGWEKTKEPEESNETVSEFFPVYVMTDGDGVQITVPGCSYMSWNNGEDPGGYIYFAGDIAFCCSGLSGKIVEGFC